MLLAFLIFFLIKSLQIIACLKKVSFFSFKKIHKNIEKIFAF